MEGNNNYSNALEGEKMENIATAFRDLHVKLERRAKDELDEIDRTFSFQMRTIFTEYVRLFCPDYVDKIDWDYFENLKSMSDNLEIQKNIWNELN